MSSGFVYIMINPAMPGLVKIGLTERTSDDRAKDLRSTGLPTDFITVYDELVTDCKTVEKRMHARFDSFRYQPNREFFEIPVRQAIRGLMEESVGYLVPRIGTNCGVEILPDLKKKYPDYLKPDFHSIKLTHSDGVVYLESVRYRHSGLKDEIIERRDLSFIDGSTSEMFPASRSPMDNARLFVHQLDEYSMIHCTDLFTHEACMDIAQRHES
ncbi:GIY-YIG nuclease family protein [Pseudomonas protegens]|uniref:GIY-YIG nuclease family protein n=1 Tax=Pseudomonas TaxID=286 RepID=UPI001372964C|nr:MULTISPECIES: GIY-YIG nuclease family protein [Pseudomonas]MBF0641458.1 GIY-YIG nuclease family protein [Pseudomonas protegens]MDT9641495.1 GIY-YIG nuclease family protein [Pseudomonas sp. JV245A]NAN53449.1 GIY-YIG nuclease family protein [Pseudomonas protegens]NUE77865.1 GIY-YIG nuclease family protein [Pseudomonas protegens]